MSKTPPAPASSPLPATEVGRSTLARRPRLLIVGPLPPPLGGVQLMVDMQRKSSLAGTFEIHTVNTSKNVLRWAVETRTWRTPFHFARDLARLSSALARIRPDVVLVHAAPSVSFLRDWVFMALARLAGARVVCHYHGTLHTRFPSAHTGFGRLAGRLLMRAAHRVIVLGPTYRERFAAIWKRETVVWAPNSTKVAQFQSPAADRRPRWLGDGERAVLFMGRLSAPKGIWDLFDAMPLVLTRHPGTRFLLCGVAEKDAQEPQLRAAVAERGLAPHVTFLGSVEGLDRIMAYATSALFVLPSWTEAFPLVIPEAMAAGLPLVVTAVGAIPDFVHDGDDGVVVPPRDPAALAAGMIRLLDDPVLCRRISERLRERAWREFDVEVGARIVGAVLLETLAERQRS
jgi:glycosyltransferase involved in cell wall biosynthesis